jgi:hypothetical protein
MVGEKERNQQKKEEGMGGREGRGVSEDEAPTSCKRAGSGGWARRVSEIKQTFPRLQRLWRGPAQIALGRLGKRDAVECLVQGQMFAVRRGSSMHEVGKMALSAP